MTKVELAPAPSKLHYVLRDYLGSELSPEVAARIVSRVCGNSMPLPVDPSGVLDCSQATASLDFLNARLPWTKYRAEECRTMALIRPDGAIAAVAAFTGPQLHDIELSLATDGRADWASRRTLSAVLGYAFQQLDKPRVTVNANSERPDLVRLYERAGFQVEGLIRLGYGRADRVAMGMLRKECPWIGDRHGK